MKRLFRTNQGSAREGERRGSRTALRQSIAENEEGARAEFQPRDFLFHRDRDTIFLYYYMTITQDLEIHEAMRFVDAAVERVHTRADQLVNRRRDGLLGIFERSSFDADLNHALMGKQPVALVMVDVDHFKRVNDTFGHAVGDEVLRAVAKILTSECDGRHQVEYRYGGDELALIVVGNDAARATQLAESIRADVEQLVLPSVPELKVTISVGIALDGNSESSELMKRADAALYRAKEDGRNIVRVG
jgi:diguanylate cyclase (GGDEF)-like protein